MALNTQTQSLALSLPLLFFPPPPSSLLHTHKLSICIFFLAGSVACVFFYLSHCHLSLQISCCFNESSWAFFFSFHTALSPFISLPFSAKILLTFFTHTLSFLSSCFPFFFFLKQNFLLASWLVFVSLSLVAAVGSGLNKEITFSVWREAARSST